MAENFIEDLMYEYYKMKGYFVMQNYWFDFNTPRERTQKDKKQVYSAKSWSDIDIIAINEKEMNIVQVKSIINDEKAAENIVRSCQHIIFTFTIYLTLLLNRQLKRIHLDKERA